MGKFYIIMGHSGNGKSTLLKILIGEEEADSGSLRRGWRVRALSG